KKGSLTRSLRWNTSGESSIKSSRLRDRRMEKQKQHYDVFLSYARSDGEVAEAIGRSLADAGLRVWVDSWKLVPGMPWQEPVERAIRESAAIALCIGKSGIGPRQQAEFHDLRLRGSEHVQPVISVLLPGAETETLPSFVRDLTWVDFRDGLDNP